MPTLQQQLAAEYLVNAVSEERIERVAALLADGSNPNISLEDGVYPLGLATFRGRLDIVRLLLRHGARVGTHAPGGPTALHTACVGGHVAIIQKLIAAGADPNETSDKDQSPLHWVARKGSVQVLRCLIQAGSKMDAKDDDGYAPIHYAADAGNILVLRELVSAGSSHTWRNNTSQTPLLVACMTGHPACVKYLLDKCKADPGAADDMGFTPLVLAAQHGHYEAVDMLLKFGVSQLGPNAYRDALSGVAMAGNVRMIRTLICVEGGAHVKGAKTSAKMTPLHFTAGYCHPLSTSTLLEAGEDENAQDIEGKMPVDVVDTMRSEHVQHGLGRRRVKRMLAQAPAYRARSWRWPNASVGSPLLLTAESAKDEAESTHNATRLANNAAGSTKNAAESVTGEAGAGAAESETEPAEMTAEDFDLAFEAAMAIAAKSAGTGKVGVTVYRQPTTSSSGAAASRHPAVVASLIRYSQKT